MLNRPYMHSCDENQPGRSVAGLSSLRNRRTLSEAAGLAGLSGFGLSGRLYEIG